MNTRNFREYLPSKPIQIVVGVLLLVGIVYLGYLVFKNRTPRSQDSRYVNVEFINAETRAMMQTDSDNDGLYDWEEILWGLDPYDPYSNGNGILDGKYVEAKQLNDLPRYGQSIPESNLSESEKLGRSLYTALLAVEQRTGSAVLDSQTSDQMADNVEYYLSNLTLGQRVYLRENLNRVADTQQNARAYREAMRTLFARSPVSLADIELLLMASENPIDYRGSLVAASRKYKSYLETIVPMPVPNVVAGRHVALVNNVSQIDAALDNLLATEQDELVIVSSLIQLEGILNNIIESIFYINQYFDLVDDTSLFTGVGEYEDEEEEDGSPVND